MIITLKTVIATLDALAEGKCVFSYWDDRGVLESGAATLPDRPIVPVIASEDQGSFQPLAGKSIGDGSYRLTFLCPLAYRELVEPLVESLQGKLIGLPGKEEKTSFIANADRLQVDTVDQQTLEEISAAGILSSVTELYVKFNLRVYYTFGTNGVAFANDLHFFLGVTGQEPQLLCVPSYSFAQQKELTPSQPIAQTQAQFRCGTNSTPLTLTLLYDSSELLRGLRDDIIAQTNPLQRYSLVIKDGDRLITTRTVYAANGLINGELGRVATLTVTLFQAPEQ